MKAESEQSETDTRSVAISNCYLINASAVMSLNVLRLLEEKGMSQSDFQNLFGGISGSHQAALENFGKMTRLGYIVLFQFQIENMLKTILKALGKSGRATEGFYNVAKSLLDAITLADLNTKLDLLYLPALIRNSLHSNGIHRLESKRIEYDGLVFEFIKDAPVRCAAWDHMHHALNASLNVVDEILKATQVKALPDPTPDQFVSEEAQSRN